MKAIYLGWQCDESCGSDLIATFTEDYYKIANIILEQLRDKWPELQFFISPYTSPKLNPQSIDDLKEHFAHFDHADRMGY